MSAPAKWEYRQAVYPRYRQARRREKQRILDEFCRIAGYHRKYAIRLLRGPAPGPAPRRPRRRAATYGPAVITALHAIWQAAGYPWSVRLKALLPLWLPWARHRLRLARGVERQLLAISARQIDRRLAPHKRQLKQRLYGRTKPGTLLKHHIPIKTDAWAVTTPGFAEVDLVSHSGNAADGKFIHSLNLTDVHSAWVETGAVLGKGAAGIQRMVDELRTALPFALRGLDSDNGAEFINGTLYDYCQAHEIQFTRGRPYKKDDNAHVEQKTWTHVRKLLGYVRYDSPAALARSMIERRSRPCSPSASVSTHSSSRRPSMRRSSGSMRSPTIARAPARAPVRAAGCLPSRRRAAPDGVGVDSRPSPSARMPVSIVGVWLPRERLDDPALVTFLNGLTGRDPDGGRTRRPVRRSASACAS